MKNFKNIVITLKSYLKEEEQKKILDKDVAQALDMSASRFATLKKRDTTPYENILNFCKKENLCCNEILFD